MEDITRSFSICNMTDPVTGIRCALPAGHSGICTWQVNMFRGMDDPAAVLKSTEIPLYFPVRVEMWGVKPEQLIGIRVQYNGVWYRVMMYDEARNVYIVREDE